MKERLSQEKLVSTDRLLREKEVAQILGTGLSTVQQWRLRGKGPKFCRLGSRMIRYRESDIRAYIENMEAYSSTSGADAGR